MSPTGRTPLPQSGAPSEPKLTDIPIRCSCGKLQGKLRGASPRSGNHVICHCKDCQNFARYLGRADDVLDKWGGTEVYQASPGRLELTSGVDQLACVHLTEQPTLRWYANCCKTPLGNTLATNKLPFIGLIHAALDASAFPGGLDSVIGPVRARVNGSDATGNTSEIKLYKSAPFGVYLRFFKVLLASKFSGNYRKSPLFDPATGRPVVKPIRSAPTPAPPEAPPESRNGA